MDQDELQNSIEECDETHLFLIIEGLGGMLWFFRHDLANGRLESTPAIEKDLVYMQARIEEAVDQTQRFGVEVPRYPGGGATEEYWKWFRKHKDWWNTLGEEEQLEINARYNQESR